MARKQQQKIWISARALPGGEPCSNGYKLLSGKLPLTGFSVSFFCRVGKRPYRRAFPYTTSLHSFCFLATIRPRHYPSPCVHSDRLDLGGHIGGPQLLSAAPFFLISSLETLPLKARVPDPNLGDHESEGKKYSTLLRAIAPWHFKTLKHATFFAERLSSLARYSSKEHLSDIYK